MRVIDILTEAGLTPRDFYEKYRLANFINKLSNKEPFFTTKGEQIVVPATAREIAELKALLKTSFDPKDPSPKARNIAPIEDKIPTVIGGVRLKTLQKTKDFGGTIAISASGETDVSKANLGPTVEALKSFAIYAKLVMRGKDKITAEDVQKIGKLADEHSKVIEQGASKTPTTLAIYKRQVFDTNKQVKDIIQLKVALSAPSFQRAVRITPADKTAWGNLQGILNYVNTESDIGKYSRYFAGNNKRDPLNISVVGIGGAKTDISSTYTDPTGKEKPIQNLNMSVKSAGAEWYDQSSGSKVTGVKNFYEIMGLSEDLATQAMSAVKFKEGGKADTDAEFAYRLAAMTKLYGVAYKQLKARIPQLNDKGEADYIHEFIGKLKHSLAGNENLVYVKFDANGTYEKLKPHALAKLVDVIDLDVNFTTTGRPTIFWVDKKTGKTLIYVVLLKNPPNKRLTNQFNLGKDFFPLLKQATNLANAPRVPAVPAPVAATAMATPEKLPRVPQAGQPVSPGVNTQRAGDADFVEPDDELRYSGE